MSTDAVGRRAEVSAFLELGKLRLSSLAVFAVLAGLYLGADVAPPWPVVVGCCFGTMLVAMGANALNMYIEREPDRRMPRTQNRPLPEGRLTPGQVLAFGIFTGAAGTAWLWLVSNTLATVLCAAILLTYVAAYTPLKRVTTLNTLVGAIPGALPPLVGYAAGAGTLDLKALVLFAILFLWQIPHFLAIAWRYRVDYSLGGMRMLPSEDPEGRMTSRQMVLYTLALILATQFAYEVELAGPLYLIVSLFLGILFLVPVVVAAFFRVESAMRLCFLASILYLPALLGVMVLDKIP